MKVYSKVSALAIYFIFFNLFNVFPDEATRHLLKNGIVVLIEDSHRVPLVAVEARIKTGSATEYGYLGSGISHFVEHMLFKGTKSLPAPGDIEGRIKALGGYINAFTSHDSTAVDIIIPSQHLNKSLELLRDILTESLFDPEEMEKEREVILKEIRLNNDDPQRRLSVLLWSNMFKTHNYRFPVIGHEALLNKLKRDDLLNYYKANYIPDNTVLAIVGDIDRAEAIKTIEGLFGGIERSSPQQGYFHKEPPQIAEVSIEEQMDTALAYLAMGFHSVSARDKDMFDLDVLSIILGGGEDSRLVRALYKEKELVYSVGSYNHTQREPGLFAITAVLKKENLEPAIDEIGNELKAIKTPLVSDRELMKAKNNVLSDYVFSRQTVQAKANDLAGNEVIVGDYDFSRKYVEGIKAVTKESVREAAKKYLKDENLTVVKILPNKGPSPLPSPQRGEGEVVLAPQRGEGEVVLSSQGREEEYGKIKIDISELKNGLKVLILEDRSLPLVTLEAMGLGGLRAEDFKNNGISNLAANALLCGTKTKTEEELFLEIESAGAALDSFAGANTFGVSCAGLSRDFGLLARILSDVLQNPRFDAQKIEREKRTALGNIKATNDDIYQLGMRTLKYNLFRRHPYRLQGAGRRGAVKALSQNDIYGHYTRYYNPAGMLLIISGDVDKVAVRRQVAALFEKFERRPAMRFDLPKEKRRPAPRILRRNAQKEQSLLLLGYLGTTVYSHDKYVLSVLSSVLSGVNGRLSRRMREELGLAYTVDAVSVPGIEAGMFVFYIGTTKENLELARRELFSQIDTLKKEGLGEEELRAAKNQLVGFHQMGLQRPQDIARKAGMDELYGLGYDNFLKYENRIRRITKECVVRAARKYLNDNAYVLLTIMGEG